MAGSDDSIITHCIDLTPFYTDSKQESMQENSYKFFLENIQGLAFQVMKSPGGIQVFQTGSYEAITGYPIEKFKEMEFFFSIVHPDDRQKVADYNARLYQSAGSFNIEYRIITHGGEIKWLRSYDQHLVRDKGRQMIQGMMFDVTLQKKQELILAEAFQTITEQNVKLDLLSRTDPLTGLENRRSFLKLLNVEINRYRRQKDTFSLVMLDIDHFKAINDVHGHDVGDKALVSLSDTFKANLRTIDHMGRWGGEEFLILLVSSSSPQALLVIEKLQDILKQTTIESTRGGELFITFSAGIVEPREGESAEDLIKRADLTMYRAKAAGRNRIILDDE